jgi:hypothetical protein
MSRILSSNFIDLTLDAALKVFWRKNALRRFLRQHHISENELATWHSEDESKRDYLTRLFDKLIGIKDYSGYKIISNMAQALAEMEHFPDLENWEDSKLKINSAKDAVGRLKSEVKKLDKQLSDEQETIRRRQTAEEEQKKHALASQSLEKLTAELSALVPHLGTVAGGFAFEKWFYGLVGFFELPARPPYKDSNGRQIDGSVTIDGTTFLIETKFTKEQTTPDAIDSFLSKIGTKADNTMGLLVSMGGFNPGAIKTASRDRTPILLMDYSHLYNLILSEMMGLPDVIRRILRHASQTGESFLGAADFSG